MESFLGVIAKLPVAGGISSFLVAAFIYALLRGFLVPRSAVDDVRADRDARLAEVRRESDDWRTAWTDSQETNRILADQVKELIELARTTNQLIMALPSPPAVTLPRELAP